MADSFTVERRTHVKGSPASILERITDFRRWQAWSPWEDIDPNLQRTYSGAESGVGAVYEWSGDRKAGAGRMEITDVVEGESVTIDLQFLKPFKAHNEIVFMVRSDDMQTSEVRWVMTGAKTFMVKVMGIFKSMDKMVGPDFEKGLERLKADVER